MDDYLAPRYFEGMVHDACKYSWGQGKAKRNGAELKGFPTPHEDQISPEELRHGYVKVCIQQVPPCYHGGTWDAEPHLPDLWHFERDLHIKVERLRSKTSPNVPLPLGTIFTLERNKGLLRALSIAHFQRNSSSMVEKL